MLSSSAILRRQNFKNHYIGRIISNKFRSMLTINKIVYVYVLEQKKLIINRN